MRTDRMMAAAGVGENFPLAPLAQFYEGAIRNADSTHARLRPDVRFRHVSAAWRKEETSTWDE